MTASITITIDDLGGLARLTSGLEKLLHLDERALLTEIGALGESQTRRRIESEKTAPDGTPWAPNAEGTSILLRTGNHLRDSVAYHVAGAGAEWGASWEFAHVHQNGATILPKSAKALLFTVHGRKVAAKKVTIPARPFVGISPANALEFEHLVTDHLGRLLQ